MQYDLGKTLVSLQASTELVKSLHDRVSEGNVAAGLKTAIRYLQEAEEKLSELNDFLARHNA